MKYIGMYLLVFTLGLVFPARANAQVPVTQDTPLINQYIADAYEQRSAAWWNALGRQLTLSVDIPYEQVKETALQNIIFFATHHGEKVKLNDAAPTLLTIYQHHDQVAFRMMALAALHAIGDESTMQRLNQIVEQEASDRVRHVTVAALHDHYHRQ